MLHKPQPRHVTEATITAGRKKEHIVIGTVAIAIVLKLAEDFTFITRYKGTTLPEQIAYMAYKNAMTGAIGFKRLTYPVHHVPISVSVDAFWYVTVRAIT